jgi:hypothetical protein
MRNQQSCALLCRILEASRYPGESTWKPTMRLEPNPSNHSRRIIVARFKRKTRCKNRQDKEQARRDEKRRRCRSVTSLRNHGGHDGHETHNGNGDAVASCAVRGREDSNAVGVQSSVVDVDAHGYDHLG